MKITDAIKERRLFFDGGMGTHMQEMGIRNDETTESWSITHPEEIIGIHRGYLEAGSDVIATNTFRVNGLRYDEEEIREIVHAACTCARKAMEGFSDRYLAFDLGPTGRLLKPLGDLDPEDAVKAFGAAVRAAADEGVDLILIETMNDSMEAKAAAIAVKENTDLPFIISNAYDERGKLMTGSSPEVMVSIAEGLGAMAVGLNCSLGPDKLTGVYEKLEKASSIPVIVMPNAGLPEVRDGRTVYNVGADEFADVISTRMTGAAIMGGCCGTTPEYIRKLRERMKDVPYVYPEKKDHTFISSFGQALDLNDGHVLVGERINPTGKKDIKEAIVSKDYPYIMKEAIKQEEKGVHVIDVNAGVPGIDEGAALKEMVVKIQGTTDLPLQIDSADPDALEKAVRAYNGKPLINSVNGKEESMKKVFPLVKKYGGAVIALTMDENGIPDTAEERCRIAQRIVDKAAKYGIDKKEIIVDPLALTVSSDQRNAQVTLDAIEMLHKDMGLKTSLGVSNISFGLPERDVINANFFAKALDRGLDISIMNPMSRLMTDAYYAHNVLNGKDTGCKRYIDYTAGMPKEAQTPVTTEDETLGFAIEKGIKEDAERIAGQMVRDTEPLDIINEHIIPALDRAGDRFERKEIFLPQLILTADAANSAFRELKKHIPDRSDEAKKIVIATVKGDIHDIGKNIVKVILESYGYSILDLGRDVDPETVAEAAEGCRLVGLSALMTTTVPAMEETIALIHARCPGTKVMVGGAVLTADYAREIKADYYSKDAMGSVRIADEVFER